MDLWDMLDPAFDRLACFCTHVLGLVSAPFVSLLKKKPGYKKNSDGRPLKFFPREIAERSGETVGSLLLEIVIMLTL